MTTVRALVLAAAGCTASAGALAQEAGAYLGGSLGQAKLKEWCDTSGAPPGGVLLSCEDSDTAWKIFGGYRFNRYLAVEGSYMNWGKATGEVIVFGTRRQISAEQTSLGAAVVGSLALAPQFSVFGKAGLLITSQEISVSGAASEEPSESEFHYGFGASYAVTRNWAVRGEWERTEKLKVEMFSIGAEYRF